MPKRSASIRRALAGLTLDRVANRITPPAAPTRPGAGEVSLDTATEVGTTHHSPRRSSAIKVAVPGRPASTAGDAWFFRPSIAGRFTDTDQAGLVRGRDARAAGAGGNRPLADGRSPADSRASRSANTFAGCRH